MGLLSVASWIDPIIFVCYAFSFTIVTAHPYNGNLTDYNININQSAGGEVLFYNSDWPEKRTNGYNPSPVNWRALPTYTVILDRFVDGDPSNNDYFGTRFEWELNANQLRHGGDIVGLTQDRVLDYIYGMGYRTIYIAGTPWVNMPWQSDGYSALDFTLLDPHYGTLAEWRAAIDKIHSKGMYIMLDLTVTTMADLIGVKDFLNASSPFNLEGYQVEYKNAPYAPWGLEGYADFNFTNERSTDCSLPRFFNPDGSLISSLNETFTGCYKGDFDQFGDIDAVGIFLLWKRQLAKFGGVQDRLRDWDDIVAAKLEKLACMPIQALDVDAFRIDKASQMSLDFSGQWGSAVKTCASSLGKKNFFITGEIGDGNMFGSLYIGRGRQAEHYAHLNTSNAMEIKANQSQSFMRDIGKNALDSSSFHYSVYRSLTLFLGLDHEVDRRYDVELNWITAWNQMMVSNDFLNQATGLFDPRHFYGTSNQDLFRWSSLKDGTRKMMLGQLITNLLLPGIPLAYYGEEQDLYLLDSQADNYHYGRQAMTASRAWQIHGCYRAGSQLYNEMPFDKALNGCHDDWNSLDHLDPTSGTRNMLKHFSYLRTQYPVLQDGFNLTQHGNWSTISTPVGSPNTQTESGIWSVSRGLMSNQQLSGTNSQVPVWMLYSNLNETRRLEQDCSSHSGILSPYPAPTTVRNLLFPYETYSLSPSQRAFFANGQPSFQGCLPSITLDSFSYKVFVPVNDWVSPLPHLVAFTPGHDARIVSKSRENKSSIPIKLSFSHQMSCSAVSASISLAYTIDPSSTSVPKLETATANCTSVDATSSSVNGVTPAVWSWSSTISNAVDGIYHLTINNATDNLGINTRSVDHLIIRKGSVDNPITFQNVTYSRGLLQKKSDGRFSLVSNAAGADLMRYSTDFGAKYSSWINYTSHYDLPVDVFNYTQFWTGNHIRVQYHSKLAGSAAHAVDSDQGLNDGIVRRVPQLLLRGPFNEWGYDMGTPNNFVAHGNNWTFDVITTWPNHFQLTTYSTHDELYYGDVDGDGALDLLPPNTQSLNYLNLSQPASPYLGWRITVNQMDMTWGVLPIGNESVGILLFWLFTIIPPATALFACWVFRQAFYRIKFNEYGYQEKRPFTYPSVLPSIKEKCSKLVKTKKTSVKFKDEQGPESCPTKRWPEEPNARRKVLIATLEYEIPDWKIQVKIGGLGVMAALMGRVMDDVDMVWVIPKVRDVNYPAGHPEPAIMVTIYGEQYQVICESHQLGHITYFLLDSVVFRANTKSDPYPARMDDLGSAIFYSTWNQCIAQICRRTPNLDIYHINDYHGALAPLYLLPTVLPVCLSLHNAEFQGLWPLRTVREAEEVSQAFNLPPDICANYVQYGNIFNLLHAAATFISHHQDSVGVAGVSDKYGKRSWARYPALWTLKTIDSLPNPDPTDLKELSSTPQRMDSVVVDREIEQKRSEDKRKTQEWAGLNQDPKSQLFVFVGRWSLQKGVDLVADVFTTVLEERPDVQLLAVGPVVDLYGRFSAAKLNRLMEMFPGRVFSRPEFTALPQFVFSGGDFALIPSRDEPFGLVAVEFGRGGALGVGSRLGGLGRMPGWWFPVESDSTVHMHSQFLKTIKMALESTDEERSILRARSALQRFPVLEWRARMENMHRRAIIASRKHAGSSAAVHQTPYSEILDGKIDSNLNSVGSLLPEVDFSHPSTKASMRKFSLTELTNTLSQFVGSKTKPPSQKDDTNSLSATAATTPFEEIRIPEFAANESEIISPALPVTIINKHDSVLSDSIKHIFDKHGADSPLNHEIETFDDKDGGVARDFGTKLQKLTSTNSMTELCIAHYLVLAEKNYFKKNRLHKLTLARSFYVESTGRGGVSSVDIPRKVGKCTSTLFNSQSEIVGEKSKSAEEEAISVSVQFQLDRWQIRLQRVYYGWPLYAILLAIGQVLGATSFQLSLLGGTNSPQTFDLYIIGAINIIGSIFWYVLKSVKPATWSLSMPWIFFGLAFGIIGFPSLTNPMKSYNIRHPLSLLASSFYSFASASGFLFFSANFGEEAGGEPNIWVYRACVVQGTQQIWVAALWYWGFKLQNTNPFDAGSVPSGWINVITLILASLCFFTGYILFHGLPTYYRHVPGKVPNFIKTLFRRKLVLWYIAAEILRDYWLSGPYGRSWGFLWSNQTLPVGATALLTLFFFIGVWGLIMWTLSRASKQHTWLLPIFAVGLGAPRWCQMLWGTSSVALYVPWAGRAGPYLSTSLWLWLGVLDAVQGVGLGMILLQTLSRIHVSATLCIAQIIGSTSVLVARATAPNRIGPGNVFPDLGLWNPSQALAESPVARWEFWIALACQLCIVAGYFVLFRKEQLSKP